MLISRSKFSFFSIQLWAIFLVALSGILYGFIGYFGTKILDSNFSVSNMLFWRFFTAFVWITGLTLWRKEKIFSYKKNKNIFFQTFFLSSIFYSGASALYFMASQHTGTGLAMVIFFSYPVFVAIMAWFTHKAKMNIFSIFSLIAIVLGLFFLKGHNESALNLLGIALAIAAAFFYAFYVMISKKSIGFLSSNALTFLVCFGNMLFFLVMALSTKTFALPTTFNLCLYILALGIFATALPIQLLLDGLKFVSPLKASILSVLEPMVTLIIGVTLLAETMTSLQVLGIFIVLAGAILIQFENSPE